MWKGLRRALAKSRKGPAAEQRAPDTSHRSTASSAAPSSVLFPLDVADVDALAGWNEQQQAQRGEPAAAQRQPAQHAAPAQPQPRGVPPLPSEQARAAPLSGTALQAQLQQSAALQALVAAGADDASAPKRQAAAVQKRIDSAMLNPGTTLYQISSLLSLSTLFEHKLQRDAMTALEQAPALVAPAAAAAADAAAALPCCCEPGGAPPLGSSAGSGLCGGGGACGSCGGSPARTPSATAAATAGVALALASWGYRVIVRKVLHSKAYWTKAMDNTFIVALDASGGGHVEYVVDPHFRETFNVGVVSPSYAAVLASLPAVFVGMPCQLQPVVQLLCEEVELSFLEAGRPCPPWREWGATINRWMSDQYVDILVPPPGAPAEEVADFVAACAAYGGAAGGPGSARSSGSASSGGGSPGSRLASGRPSERMHVSSVLSAASTCSRRAVPEPLHKQLGFAAHEQRGEEGASPAPPELRNASFTSPSSSGASAGASSAAAAAAALGGGARALGCSLSVPGADLLSSSAGSSAAGDDGLVRTLEPTALQRHEAAMLAAQRQAAPQMAARQQAPPAASRSGSSSSAVSSSSSGGGEGRVAPRSRSLLTAHMQLKAQLQAAQAPALQQQQQQPQHVLASQLLQQQHLAQLQLQHQATLQQLLQQQQLRQQHAAQQPLLAPLLPVVHTVRPCGAPVALPQQQPQQPQQPQPQQQQTGWGGGAALAAMQGPPGQEQQPRLLRLIPRHHTRARTRTQHTMGAAFSLLGAVALPLGSGFAVGLATQHDIKGWYGGLKKPSWNPPNWIFAPAWSVFYTSMGLASWFVIRQKDGRRVPLALYAAQLALNLAWTPLFFKQHALDLALADSVALLGVAAAASAKMAKERPGVVWPLMGPYLCWVTFATALNAEILRLNPSETAIDYSKLQKSAKDTADKAAARAKEDTAKVKAAAKDAADKTAAAAKDAADRAAAKAKEAGDAAAAKAKEAAAAVADAAAEVAEKAKHDAAELAAVVKDGVAGSAPAPAQ
ncbi:Tspo [Scenedesmus sp. PABB004]|nr:Tspo [Scenedesmus sp. PABB004]